MARDLIGQRVHSFDFDDQDLDGERACYVTGVVTGILKTGEVAEDGETSFQDCDRYIIAAESRTFAGQPQELVVPGQPFFPPLNGTPSWRGRTMNGVVRVTAPQDVAFRVMYNALKLLTITPDARNALEAVDPAALRQIRRAIETAEAAADDALIAPYDGDVPAEARSL